MGEQQQYQAARRRARQLGWFYRHLTIYIGFVAFVGIINLLTWSGDVWVQWPALAFGMPLAFHFFWAFGSNRFYGNEWQEHKAAELLGEKPKRSKRDDLFEETSTE